MLPPQIICAYWPWVYLTWTTTQCAITGFMSLPVGSDLTKSPVHRKNKHANIDGSSLEQSCRCIPHINK